jgi:hypothetical protein
LDDHEVLLHRYNCEAGKDHLLAQICDWKIKEIKQDEENNNDGAEEIKRLLF